MQEGLNPELPVRRVDRRLDAVELRPAAVDPPPDEEQDREREEDPAEQPPRLERRAEDREQDRRDDDADEDETDEPEPEPSAHGLIQHHSASPCNRHCPAAGGSTMSR